MDLEPLFNYQYELIKGDVKKIYLKKGFSDEAADTYADLYAQSYIAGRLEVVLTLLKKNIITLANAVEALEVDEDTAMDYLEHHLRASFIYHLERSKNDK